MEFRVEAHQLVDVIAMTGRLDLVGSSALKDLLRQRLSDRRVNLLLDLEKVHFMNSSGIGALISSLRDVRLSHGRLALCRLAPYLQEIFAITNLTRVFDCYSSVDDALLSFAPPTREPVARR